MLLLAIFFLVILTAFIFPGWGSDGNIRDGGTTLREGWGGLSRRKSLRLA